MPPLILAAVGHTEEYRGFWVEFGVGLGFVGLAMMGLQFVLTARYNKIGAPFGLDELLQFHGQAGYIAWGFIMAHFLILFVADARFVSFLDPTVNLPRAVALSGVIVAITLLIATTYWRKKIGLIYEWWRAFHGVLALFVVFVGTIHILQVGFYITEIWQQVIWIGLSAGVIGMLLHNRVWRPLQMKKCPWKVVGVKEEVAKTWSIELEADGHDGIEFKAGQFIWLTLGNTPFSLQQHPFTISSSPKEKIIRLTIKELGDFTSQISDTEVGSTAFIEGPYGGFILDKSSDAHIIFIVGGIGITPAISMLESLRDDQDTREITLIYGSPSKELTPFLDELKNLSAGLNLNVVHVYQEPPEVWEGETGFIDEDILKRNLPDDLTNCVFYICGPPPLMDMAELTLHRWGVPVYNVHSERFNIV